MNQETWNLIITTFKWFGTVAIAMWGGFKAWKEYLSNQSDKLQKQIDRDVAIAKERSAGEQAIKMIDADIDLIQKEIEAVKAFRSKSETDYTVLHTLIEKLREDYKFIMDRIFPSHFKITE